MNRAGGKFLHISSASYSFFYASREHDEKHWLPAGRQNSVSTNLTVRPGNSKAVISAGFSAALVANIPRDWTMKKKSKSVAPVKFWLRFWKNSAYLASSEGKITIKNQIQERTCPSTNTSAKNAMLFLKPLYPQAPKGMQSARNVAAVRLTNSSQLWEWKSPKEQPFLQPQAVSHVVVLPEDDHPTTGSVASQNTF